MRLRSKEKAKKQETEENPAEPNIERPSRRFRPRRRTPRWYDGAGGSLDRVF